MLETRRYVNLDHGTTVAVCYAHYDMAPGKLDLRLQFRGPQDTAKHRLLFQRDDRTAWTLRIDDCEAVPILSSTTLYKTAFQCTGTKELSIVNWTLVASILGLDQGYERAYRIQEECLHKPARHLENPNAQAKEKRIDAGVIIRRRLRHHDQRQEFWLQLPDYRLFSSREYAPENGLIFQSEYIDIQEHPTFRPPVLEELSDYLPSDAAVEAAALADSSA